MTKFSDPWKLLDSLYEREIISGQYGFSRRILRDDEARLRLGEFLEVLEEVEGENVVHILDLSADDRITYKLTILLNHSARHEDKEFPDLSKLLGATFNFFHSDDGGSVPVVSRARRSVRSVARFFSQSEDPVISIYMSEASFSGSVDGVGLVFSRKAGAWGELRLIAVRSWPRARSSRKS